MPPIKILACLVGIVVSQGCSNLKLVSTKIFTDAECKMPAPQEDQDSMQQANEALNGAFEALGDKCIDDGPYGLRLVCADCKFVPQFYSDANCTEKIERPAEAQIPFGALDLNKCQSGGNIMNMPDPNNEMGTILITVDDQAVCPDPTLATEEPEEEGMSTGLIIGIAVGAAVVFIIAVAVLVYCYKKKKEGGGGGGFSFGNKVDTDRTMVTK